MSQEICLQAIFERDASADGCFVYGVASTRIFCRPSCASKRPKPENIRVFETTEAAQNAGFRACLRCKPLDLARQLEKTGATRAFESAAQISNRQWRENERMNELKTQLQAGKSVIEAQNEAGFGSARALYERAPEHLGMTPASYGKGGQGAQIRFALVPCALGWLLVARTEIGVCSVMLGGGETELENRLCEEFFAAQIRRDDAELRAEIEILLASLQNAMPSPVLPLDVRMTAFQIKVWTQLTRLKRGETISYGELAARMECPRAVRAVASACGQNPVALVHPCHRVVGKNGEMTGYRWGLERKKQLLELEND